MSRMKYSGVEWIGDIPENWNIKKIKYIYNIQTGFTPDTSRDDYYSLEKQNVWVSIADLTSCEGKYINDSSNYISNLYIREKHPKIVKKDSLLYSFKLSVGKTAFAGKDLYTNEAIAAFDNNNNVWLNYLNYASFLIEYNSNKNIYNALILNQELIKNSITIIPPLNEQKLIADFLDEKVSNLDNILFDLNKQIEILTSYKKSIIIETVTKGLNKNIKLKDSGVEWIGNIPKHWKITKNKYQIKIHNGKEIIEEMGEIPVYGTGGCFKNTNDYLYNGESVLLGRKGTIDNPMYVKGKFWTVDTCYYTTSYGKLMLKLFYYFSMCFDYKYYQTGSTLPSMTQYDLGSICIPDIPMNEQKEIVDYLDKKCEQIDKIIEEKQKQIKKIEEYKKSVIYEYVTGKKRVEGAEELYG